MKQADLYKASVRAEKLYELASRRTVLAEALASSQKFGDSKQAAVPLARAVGMSKGPVEFNLQALQQLVYSRILDIDAELKAEGVELDAEKVYPPGLLYSSLPGKVYIAGEVARAVRAGLEIIRAEAGTWSLDKKGGLELQGDNGLPRADKLYVSPQITKQVSARIVEPVSLEGYEFNKPQDLPPVGSVLLIKIPAGTEISSVTADHLKFSLRTLEEDTVFSAFRTKHLSDRNGQMEYRLSDDSLVTGRFEWTYP